MKYLFAAILAGVICYYIGREVRAEYRAVSARIERAIAQ
jgi:hypothetical protein